MLSDDKTSNPKRFWSFIKGKRTESTGVAPLRREDFLLFRSFLLSDKIVFSFVTFVLPLYQSMLD
jgi:hypothetical protein